MVNYCTAVISKLTHDDQYIDIKPHRQGCKELRTTNELIGDMEFINTKVPGTHTNYCHYGENS